MAWDTGCKTKLSISHLAIAHRFYGRLSESCLDRDDGFLSWAYWFLTCINSSKVPIHSTLCQGAWHPAVTRFGVFHGLQQVDIKAASRWNIWNRATGWRTPPWNSASTPPSVCTSTASRAMYPAYKRILVCAFVQRHVPILFELLHRAECKPIAVVLPGWQVPWSFNLAPIFVTGARLQSVRRRYRAGLSLFPLLVSFGSRHWDLHIIVEPCQIPLVPCGLLSFQIGLGYITWYNVEEAMFYL